MIARDRVTSAIRAMVAVATAAVFAAPFMLAAGTHNDDRRPVVLAGAQAWLVNRAQGTVTLVDGPSASWAGDAPLPAQTDSDVAQYGGSAIALDRATGELHKLDGSTGLVTAIPVTAARNGPTQIIAARDEIYLFPGRAGIPERVDDVTRGIAVDPSTEAADELLAATPRGAALVNLALGTVTWPSGSTVRVASDPGDRVTGDRATGDVYLVHPGRRTLTRCTRAGCEATGRFDGDGRLGAPVVAEDRVLVPDLDHGNVLTLPTGRSRPSTTAERIVVFDRSAGLELVEQQGYTFVNDPESDRAAVIDPADHVRKLSKLATGKGRPPTPPPPPARTATAPPTSSPTPFPASRTETVSPTRIPPTPTPPGTTSPTDTARTTGPTTAPPTSRTKSPTSTGTPTTRTSSPTAPDPGPTPGWVTLEASGVHVSVAINEPAPPSRTYWLIVQTSDPPGYFAHWKVDGPEKTLEFPESADKDATRRAFVVAATPEESAAYEAHLETDPELREPIDPPGNRYSNRVPIVIPD